jgi:hypothetical protein
VVVTAEAIPFLEQIDPAFQLIVGPGASPMKNHIASKTRIKQKSA